MEAFVGTILPWPLSWAPVGWALCQGQEMQIQQNAALYSLIGVTYGGNATSTFNLPDLRCRVPIGAGAGPALTPRALGKGAGAETAALTLLNLPQHSHPATFSWAGGGAGGTLQASAQQGNTTSPQGNYLANALFPGDPGSGTSPLSLASYVTPNDAGTLETLSGLSVSGSGAATVTVGPTGGSQPVSTMPPFLPLNFIICIEGFYPQKP